MNNQLKEVAPWVLPAPHRPENDMWHAITGEDPQQTVVHVRAGSGHVYIGGDTDIFIAAVIVERVHGWTPPELAEWRKQT